MKKFIHMILISFVAAILLAGCNQATEDDNVDEVEEDQTEQVEEQGEEENQVSDSEADEESIAVAESFIEQLSQRQYEEAEASLNETMTEQIGAAELEELWVSLEEQLGDFLDYEYRESGEADEYQIVLISGVFNNMDVTFQVTVDENKEVAGFFIQE